MDLSLQAFTSVRLYVNFLSLNTKKKITIKAYMYLLITYRLILLQYLFLKYQFLNKRGNR